MTHTINNKEVNIQWDRGYLIERHDSGCAEYAMTGVGDDGLDYEGVGDYQCGELIDVIEIEAA